MEISKLEGLIEPNKLNFIKSILPKLSEEEQYQLNGFFYELIEDSRIDPLTKLPNRRHFNEILGKEMARAYSTLNPLSLSMFDIDHFKSFNDTHGHDIGDLVLKTVAIHTKSNIRKSDTAARFGGEEFTIVFPDTNLYGALRRSYNLNKDIGNTTINVNSKEKKEVTVNISLGVTEVDQNDSVWLLYGRLGRALIKDYIFMSKKGEDVSYMTNILINNYIGKFNENEKERKHRPKIREKPEREKLMENLRYLNDFVQDYMVQNQLFLYDIDTKFEDIALQSLIKRADQALYFVKNNGRNNVAYFDENCQGVFYQAALVKIS